jgi:2-polyprenyl-3-methyl-5-hydroxy-6-metoxy-1,4-benzoquinol methylase
MFDLGVYEYFEDENLALLRHGPSGARVLDVGCGSGLLGARLRTRGNAVWGVDAADDVVEPAGRRLDRFILADIDDRARIGESLRDERFDVLVFADVLEHLPDPVGTLHSYLPFLAPGGMVLVSVPNIAVWYVRVALLLGRFQYTATGTLDRTHLRFFTRVTLERALLEAGLRVQEIDVNPGIARVFVGRAKRVLARSAKTDDRRALLDSRAYRMYRRLVYPLEYRIARLAPGMLAFQYVAVARVAERSE